MISGTRTPQFCSWPISVRHMYRSNLVTVPSTSRSMCTATGSLEKVVRGLNRYPLDEIVTKTAYYCICANRKASNPSESLAFIDAWCRRRDSNSHGQGPLPPQDSVSTNSTTSAGLIASAPVSVRRASAAAPPLPALPFPPAPGWSRARLEQPAAQPGPAPSHPP